MNINKKYIAYIAVAISVLLSSFWSYWGINEFFHEGWYVGSILERTFLFFGQYMSFSIIFTAIALLAMKFKKAGLVIYVLLGAFSAVFFNGASFQVAYLSLALPFVFLGMLFYFGEFKNIKTLRLILFIPPLLIALAFGSILLYRNVNRLDDGNYGERILDCQGEMIAWAPQGPGWPDSGKSWTDAVEVCKFLSSDGITMLEEEQNIWRLPSVDEAVRCQMRHNENAGGSWDEELGQASYNKKPDKETPLWRPSSEVIYYWTSEMSRESESQAYIFTYNGGVFDKNINYAPNTQSFRCVKDIRNVLPSANGKLKATDCLAGQRSVDSCAEIYQPVCGQVQVECIKAPCSLIHETFENSCKACANPRVLSYTEGECAENDKIKY